MNELINEFLKNDTGGIIVTDSECNVLYTNNKITMSEKLKIKWSNSMPKAKLGQHGEVWEFYDSDSKIYYRITTSSYLMVKFVRYTFYLIFLSILLYLRIFQNCQ